MHSGGKNRSSCPKRVVSRGCIYMGLDGLAVVGSTGPPGQRSVGECRDRAKFSAEGPENTGVGLNNHAFRLMRGVRSSVCVCRPVSTACSAGLAGCVPGRARPPL